MAALFTSHLMGGRRARPYQKIKWYSKKETAINTLDSVSDYFVYLSLCWVCRYFWKTGFYENDFCCRIVWLFQLGFIVNWKPIGKLQ